MSETIDAGELERMEKHYADLIGFVPPRIRARLRVSGKVDPCIFGCRRRCQVARIDDDDVGLSCFEVPALLGESVAERAEGGMGELPLESRGPGAVPRRVGREIDTGELTHGLSQHEESIAMIYAKGV